jgi:uncharacterized protein (TIGR02145 family)
MNKILLSMFVLFFSVSAFAQSSGKMSYQAVIRDSDNEIVANRKIRIRISIIPATFDGTVVYSETHTPTTNVNGLISIIIGDGVTSDNFSAINWSSGIHFLKTEIDLSGGINYGITGISQILSVPYSFHATTADSVTGPVKELDPSFNAWNKNYLDLTNRPDITAMIEENAVTIKDAQQISGEKVFKGKVTVNNPVDPSDPATKEYVDAQDRMVKKMMDAFLAKYEAYLPLIDKEGNAYKTVKIGNQVWMAENLRSTMLNDGTPLELKKIDSFPYVSESHKLFYFYASETPYEREKYGALYNGYAVSTGKLCPAGWHVPSIEEFNTLIEYLNNNGYSTSKSNKISGEAKSLASFTGWRSGGEGTPGSEDYPEKQNLSGFNAFPGGSIEVETQVSIEGGMLVNKVVYKAFWGLNDMTSFWTSYEKGARFSMYYNYPSLMFHQTVSLEGNSVRCIKNK